MVIFFGVYLAITLLASTLARTQAMAAAGAFGGVALILFLSAIPRVQEAMPGKLLGWGTARLLGAGTSAWLALGVSLGLIVLCLAMACVYFEGEEI
jgi:hypothetical protein